MELDIKVGLPDVPTFVGYNSRGPVATVEVKGFPRIPRVVLKTLGHDALVELLMERVCFGVILFSDKEVLNCGFAS